MLVLFAGSLLAQPTNWIAAGNRALDEGRPEEAAADFAQALNIRIRAGAPAKDQMHLRITLATAYMEAGAYRDAEAVLQEAQKTAGQVADDLLRAELLNSWSGVHLKLGRLSEAESELEQAHRMAMRLPDPGDILPTVLHNLAGVEMLTGRHVDALSHQQEAIRLWELRLPPDHPALIRAFASLASLQYVTGQPQEARVSVERALMSAEKTYGPTHPVLADLLVSDAVVLEKLKLKKDARRARERARKIGGTQAGAGQDPMTLSVREALAADGQAHLKPR